MMYLSVRPPVSVLPSYSLTGDLLGFLRCGLQYRYVRIGNLPSSNPVQMWFGQFIHGVLEESYRRYASKGVLLPWSSTDTTDIIDLIKRRLAAQNLVPWGESLEKLADQIALSAINELGPELFPLIHRAEVRLRGARMLPLAYIPAQYQTRQLDRYEIIGVIDVISHVTLRDPIFKSNIIVNTIVSALGTTPPDDFEIILDYKGMRRHPELSTSGGCPWEEYSWQIQTYAHLRKMHDDSLPVAAGILVYVNELFLSWDDLETLRGEIASGITNIVPDKGSSDQSILSLTPPKGPKDQSNMYPPQMSIDYRLKRALRVIQVSEATIKDSLENFDKVVARIEICRGREQESGQVTASWEKNASPENIDTCKACDYRTFCPDYTVGKVPKLPAVK